VEYDLDEDDFKFLTARRKKSLSENNMELIIDRCEKEASRNGEIPSVSSIEKLLPELHPNVIQMAHNYWVKKREENGGIPLLSSLMEPPDPNDPNPLRTFRRRNDEELKQAQKKARKIELLTLTKMKQLRLDFEKLRTILEMVKKREKTKREQVRVMKEIFDLECAQIVEQRKDRTTPPNKRKSKAPPASPPPPPQRMKLNRLLPKEVEEKLKRKRPGQIKGRSKRSHRQPHQSR